MLTITADQLERLDQTQQARFASALCASIQTDYPDYARLAPVVLQVLVANALARAQSYGLTWRSSLEQFVRLMAAVAPNFDTHPAIQAGLGNDTVEPDERLPLLVKTLPDGVWAEAAENSSNLGWYLRANQVPAASEARIAAALANALPQKFRPATLNAAPFVAQSCRRAAELGLPGEDGGFTFAACNFLYGAGFESRVAWVADIFAPHIAPPLRVALLKARAAIDSGVWL
ncbi:MAG: hypothetical protein KF778_02475 [Rhodocyclaceae bacterium]|nr:hypothetical protein [Rhodocyclaceae bacterium]